jgi:hypothetical protein
MAQIQFLRHQAQKAGNLASNDKIVCREDGPNILRFFTDGAAKKWPLRGSLKLG